MGVLNLIYISIHSFTAAASPITIHNGRTHTMNTGLGTLLEGIIIAYSSYQSQGQEQGLIQIVSCLLEASCMLKLA